MSDALSDIVKREKEIQIFREHAKFFADRIVTQIAPFKNRFAQEDLMTDYLEYISEEIAAQVSDQMGWKNET